MEIGVSLPLVSAGFDAHRIAEWSQRAEFNGFRALGLLDRVIYENYDPLVALAVAAGATHTIKLVATVFMLPLRTTVLFAKQLVSLDNLSGGRLLAGVGLGGRPDDYAACEVEWERRGRIMDQQLAEMRAIWNGQSRWGSKLGPAPIRPNGPELLIGGAVKAIERAVRFGDGYTQGWAADVVDGHILGRSGNTHAGEDTAQPFYARVEELKREWHRHGRTGVPRVTGSAYYALGPNTAEQTTTQLQRFYGHDDGLVKDVVKSVATTPERVREYAIAYEHDGCDLLVFSTVIPDFAELELLTDALRPGHWKVG